MPKVSSPGGHEPLYTAPELAQYLGVPVATLYAWRTKGHGPSALRVGKHLRYRPADVEAWLDSRRSAVCAGDAPDAA